MSEWDEDRINVIGQNGNTGEHYSELGMNINLVNQYWKLDKTEPKWATEESSAVTVAMCKKFMELLAKTK